MKDKVYNSNLLPADIEYLKRVEGERGVDSDGQYSIGDKTFPQMTHVANLVPPVPKTDNQAPVVTNVIPPVNGYLGGGFFTPANSGFVLEYNEHILNAVQTFNYQLNSGSHMGTLMIERVELHVDEHGGGRGGEARRRPRATTQSVSYTHLTLPTNREV